jgi:hypothetical protein
VTGRDGWERSPSGLLVLRSDGTVVEANQTFLDWVGRTAEDVLSRLRLSELLSVGGRIYWETHLSPLLHVDRRIDEVAVELRSPAGRLPVLLSAVVSADGQHVHVAVSGARERSRYERELLAARTAADRSAGRLAVLQAATAALSRAPGLDGVVSALVTAAVGPLGAATATVFLREDGGGLVAHQSAGAPLLPPSGPALLDRTAYEEQGRVVVPLHGSVALQGVLVVAPPDDPAADPLDREVLSSVGQQAGLALDRARLYEQSTSVAHELQRSLLAGEPPVDDRYSVATAYRPGVELLEVGGDWYDVFLAAEGVLSVVVGDVVGRGLHAASAMGQLRSAVRAVAASDVGPAALLCRLDRFVEQVEAASMATVAYAELDLRSGLLRYACAGHPPPVLLPADGGGELLWGGRSTPLGAFASGSSRGEAVVQLQPGDRVLLYTDGLVERRDRALDDGFDVLTELAARQAGVPLAAAVRSLTGTMLADEQGRDDVCVLLLRWAGQPGPRR